ncbi:hypothetical protein, partial [Janthinobacterium sp. BJB446]|uniref:hypothetical protein n=1 Tax=Janthinobacterium sp. BJB446 TaxID=2048009 RepID=UPI001C55859D
MTSHHALLVVSAMIYSITYLGVPSDEHATRSLSPGTPRLPPQHELLAARTRSDISCASEATGVPNIGYVDLPTHALPKSPEKDVGEVNIVHEKPLTTFFSCQTRWIGFSCPSAAARHGATGTVSRPTVNAAAAAGAAGAFVRVLLLPGVATHAA